MALLSFQMHYTPGESGENSQTTCTDMYETSSPENQNSFSAAVSQKQFPRRTWNTLSFSFSFACTERGHRSLIPSVQLMNSRLNVDPVDCKQGLLSLFFFLLVLCSLFFVLFHFSSHRTSSFVLFQHALSCCAYGTGNPPPSVLCVVIVNVTDQAHFLLIADVIILEHNDKVYSYN